MTAVMGVAVRAARAVPAIGSLIVITLASNVRVATLAAFSAGAVWITHARYSGAAALMLLVAVAFLSIMSSG